MFVVCSWFVSIRDRAAMSRRILSLWFPCLATDVLERRRRDLAGRALAVVTAGGRGVSVVAVNRAAVAAGVAPGMTLADARAVVPGLVFQLLRVPVLEPGAPLFL